MRFESTIGDEITIVINDKSYTNIEVSFIENKPDGHIRWIRLVEIKDVDKLYKALEKEEYILPPLEKFKEEWNIILKEYENSWRFNNLL